MNKQVKQAIDNYFEDTNINYIISKDRYGSGLNTIYVDRFIHDHLWFNKKGFGIVLMRK